jgi:RND family efflux transporter MFP subunit
MPEAGEHRRWREWLADKRPRLVLAGLAAAALLSPGIISPARDRAPEPSEPRGEAPVDTLDLARFDPEPASPPLEPVEEDWFDAQEPTPAAEPTDGYECLLAPSDEVAIGTPVTGRIQRLFVDRADIVEAGQVVVSLEDKMERTAAEVARARAAMSGEAESREATAELERRRLGRADQLFDQNAVSLDIRDEIETRAVVAKLELKQAHEEQRLASLELAHAMAALERRTIRTPIPGIVIERSMSEGEVVDDETILRIARLDPLWVETVLPAARFGSVRVGMRGAVTPELPGNTDQIAEVVSVDRVIDPASGTFSVRLALSNPAYEIPSGLHCRVSFLEED